MIWIPPHEEVPVLNAYLLCPLTDAQLRRFKEQFEIGGTLTFSPQVELKIVQAPEHYVGKPHSYIRTKETEAGREDPFILIDERVVSDDAVWYVDQFASEDDLPGAGDASDPGFAQSTSVLYEILLLTTTLALSYVNFESGHMPIHEVLENLGCELPLSANYTQPQIDDGGGTDSRDVPQSAEVTAEPGEFEVTTEDRYLDNMGPRPERAVRLRKDLAEAHGFRWGEDEWTFEEPAESVTMPGGEVKEFPEGSIVLEAKYDLDFPWPEYKWPEGSL